MFPNTGVSQQTTFGPESGEVGLATLSHVQHPQWLFLPHPARSHPLPLKGIRSTLWSEGFCCPILPPPLFSLRCYPQQTSWTLSCIPVAACQRTRLTQCSAVKRMWWKCCRMTSKTGAQKARQPPHCHWNTRSWSLQLARGHHIVRKPKPAHVEGPHGEAPR